MNMRMTFPDEGRKPNARALAIAAQVDHLKALPLFAGCSKRELRHLARSTRLELLEPDATLFMEGQPSREAYVIVAGKALVRRNGRKIAELGAGDFVGELGLVLHRDHVATVTAATSLEVLVLPQDALREAVDEVPGLGWRLLQTIGDRLSENSGTRGGRN
jgi:CRP-like cAMP-binding protein